MTTEPTDLRERIARALTAHERDQGVVYAPWDGLDDHEREEYLRTADAVLPIVREAQAEAWDAAVTRAEDAHMIFHDDAGELYDENPYKPAT